MHLKRKASSRCWQVLITGVVDTSDKFTTSFLLLAFVVSSLLIVVCCRHCSSLLSSPLLLVCCRHLSSTVVITAPCLLSSLLPLACGRHYHLNLVSDLLVTWRVVASPTCRRVATTSWRFSGLPSSPSCTDSFSIQAIHTDQRQRIPYLVHFILIWFSNGYYRSSFFFLFFSLFTLYHCVVHLPVSCLTSWAFFWRFPHLELFLIHLVPSLFQLSTVRTAKQGCGSETSNFGFRIRIWIRNRILPGGSFLIRILPAGLFRSGSLSVKFSWNFHI